MFHSASEGILLSGEFQQVKLSGNLLSHYLDFRSLPPNGSHKKKRVAKGSSNEADHTAQEAGAWCWDQTDEDGENFESEDQVEHMPGKYNILHSFTNVGLLGLNLKCSQLCEFIILIQ